jgi:two-component system sensor histidine kinase TctE
VARSQPGKAFLNAAHRLRTPLAGLISQVTGPAPGTDPALRERLAKVLTGAQRSAHLVHQLLTLARTETQARREPMDLAHLAREVAREWTPRALAAHMDLGYEGDDHLPLLGDALQLREALANLLDNALRYTPAGSTITLAVQTQGGEAVVAVEDSGPGLNDDELGHQRFWRASTLPGRCGLGLAIVQEIALRHGGKGPRRAAHAAGPVGGAAAAAGRQVDAAAG